MNELEVEKDRYKKSLDDSKRTEFQLNNEINKLLATRQRDSDFNNLERKLENKIKVLKLSNKSNNY